MTKQPITIDFTVLYYNEKLLQKYNKNYPRTWDELIETARYIVQKEKEANNTLLIGYNGMMSGKYNINIKKKIIIINLKYYTTVTYS